ncbi:hypothetical protein N9127_04500, partial [Akkermansiaceae bacterium]|nr:hypothetical protein [Akkermansiaceae bacterium]
MIASSTSNSKEYYPLPEWSAIKPGKVVLCAMIFVLLWFAGDRISGIVLDKVAEQSKFRYAKLYKGGNTYDYLVLGNSRGVNSFLVPELNKLTGRKGFNLSYNGASPHVIEALLSDYYERNEAPKMIVYEVSNLNGSGNGFISNMKPFIGKSDGLSEQYSESNPDAYRATQLTHLYRYNTELFLRVLYYIPQTDQGWINGYTMDPAMIENYNPADHGWESFGLPTVTGLASLNRMIALANEHGTEFLLTVGPYLPQHIKQLPGY